MAETRLEAIQELMELPKPASEPDPEDEDD